MATARLVHYCLWQLRGASASLGAEVGIDISRETPKYLSIDAVQEGMAAHGWFWEQKSSRPD
ncbi:hypothetical protein ACFTXM_19260 [Streptomyces sp. NPDC056930]|uniref:hypothetical protein n=1 Tax=Streptomyces sp. NPDC056930 TaxID=3345967 RepID=UPI0036364ADE